MDIFTFTKPTMNYLDIFKTGIAAFFGSLLAFLQPVQNAMILLLLFAGIDILFGIISGVIALNERFNFKKFILAAAYLLVYLGIVVMVYAVGKYQSDIDESLYIIKVITYVFIYFYSSNILKNLHTIMPDNPVIRFLDYFIGLQFTKKLSILEDFIKKEQDKTKQELQGITDDTDTPKESGKLPDNKN